MKSSVFNRDVGSGVLFAVFGILGLWFGRNYDAGSTMQMGAGYFPKMLSGLLLALGVIIGTKGVVTGGLPIERIHIRPMLLVGGALVVFSLTLTRFGLIPAALALMIIGAAGGTEFKLREIIPLAIVLAAAAALLFILVLRLPLKYFVL